MMVLRFVPLEAVDDSTSPRGWTWSAAELVATGNQKQKKKKAKPIEIMEIADRYTQQIAGQPTHAHGSPIKVQTPIHGPL
jgi:hypothetical protein